MRTSDLLSFEEELKKLSPEARRAIRDMMALLDEADDMDMNGPRGWKRLVFNQ